MELNDKQITPIITTTKDWLLRHAGHRKINQIMKEEHGQGPDIRAVFCADCQEICLLGLIGGEK
jgi:hypothetical protein